MTVPITIALLAGLAWPYQWVLFNFNIRKLHFLWLVGAVLAVSFATHFALRWGKVRGIGWGLLLGLAISACFEAATFGVLFFIDDDGHAAGRALGGYLSHRVHEGYHWNRKGTSSISGWLLVVCWVIEGGAVLLAGLIGGLSAGARPFCEQCGRWATKKLWTYDTTGISEAFTLSVKSAKSFAMLMAVPSTGGGGATRLRYKVCGCSCGQSAIVTVCSLKPGDDDDETDLVGDVLVGARDLDRLFTWAEQRDPTMVGKRPTLSMLAQTMADAPAPDPQPAQALDRTLVKDAGGDPASYSRISRNYVSYGFFNADNSFTKELRRRLDEADFGAAQEALRGHKDANELAFVAEACGDWSADMPTFLAKWEEADPDSPAFHLVRGIHAVKWAWTARGAGWQPKDYPEFQRRLEFAEAHLMHAATRAPRDPTAWANLIVVARGRSRPLDAKRAFEQAVERVPDHYVAHAAMLVNLMSKWHGSTEEMFRFARAAASGAKPGSVLPLILIQAHYERTGELWREKGEKNKEGKKAAEEYWHDTGVRAEVRSVAGKVYAPGAHKVSMLTPMARAWFAWALWKCGEHEMAAEHMRIIGTSTPWGPFRPNLPLGLMPGSLGQARRQCGV